MRLARVTVLALGWACTFGPIGPSAFAQTPAPARAADPAFDILEFDVEGNSVLSAREIERAVMPFLGEKRHFSDVEGARKALEDAYQKGGYQTVFVDIPEQKVVGGTIRLHVLEGKVGQLHVTGSRYYELGQIRSAAKELAPGSVPDFNQMQQELAQLNKLPDRQVAPILSAGRTPGTVDVDLSVKDSLPLHGDLEVDNHNSPFTSALRTNASLHYDNLWQRQHSLAINYQLAPEKPSETNVLYATYLWRFPGIDDAVSLYGIRSNSNIAVVGSSTILGKAKIAGLRWIRPVGSGVRGASSYFQSLTLGIDKKDFGQTNISAETGTASVLPPISYYPLSLSYGATVVSESDNFQGSVGANSAPRGLLGNSDSAFRGRRASAYLGGEAGYLSWKFDASLEHWFSKKFSTYGKIEGQWTADPLIPNEQFITGGADSVRGYRESEVSGDRGVRGTVEVRLYPFNRPGPDGRRSLYGSVFVDGAQVRFVEPAGPQIAVTSIASAGAGLHAQNWYGLHADFDLARALLDGGRSASGYITSRGSLRVDASFGLGF